MTGAIVEIWHNKAETQRKLALDRGSRDAMADYWRMRWPSNTAKLGAREFGLTLDQGRSVVAGRASITTLDQIEKAGGWAVIFAVKALVLGLAADQYLMRQAAEDAAHARQHQQLAQAAYRRLEVDAAADREGRRQRRSA